MFRVVLNRIKSTFFSKIDLYIYREMIPNYIFGLVFFTIILLLNQLFYIVKLYIEYNVPLDQVFVLLFNLVPLMMSLTIPIGILPSYLLSMGRFSQDSEIVAMKSCGIATLRIFRPGIIFGIVISIIAFLFTDKIVVPATLNYFKLNAKIMTQKPAVELKEKSFVEIGGYKISFDTFKLENNLEVLYNIHIIDISGRRIIDAEKGRLYSDPENTGHYILKFMNGSISEVMKYKNSNNTYTDKFFIASFRYLSIHSFASVSKEYYNKTPDTMTVQELRDDLLLRSKSSVDNIYNLIKDKERVKKNIEILRNEIKKQEINISKEELLQKVSDVENKIGLLKSEINKLDKNISSYKKSLPNYYIMKYYEKFALPFSSFIFAIMSLSLGIYMVRSGRSEGLGLSLIIMLVFFGLKYGTENLIIKGILPPVFEWLYDLIFLIAGLTLLINKVRD